MARTNIVLALETPGIVCYRDFGLANLVNTHGYTCWGWMSRQTTTYLGLSTMNYIRHLAVPFTYKRAFQYLFAYEN